MKVEYIFSDGYGFIYEKTRFILSKKSYFLCRNMDGETSLRELKRKFYKKYNKKLSDKSIYSFTNKLKRSNLLTANANGYLVSKLSSPFLRKQLKRFERNKVRDTSYAGLCYKSDPKRLKKDLEECFASVDDLLLDALYKGRQRLKGIIIPHSNIELSGHCAAWSYKALTKCPMPDVFIILAPDHSYSLKYPFSVLAKDFRTPLGIVRAEKDFARALAKKCNFNIFTNSPAHIKEYAIEIQLPFLKYIYRKKSKKIRILPILCAKEPRSKTLKNNFNAQRADFIKALKKTVTESGKNVLFMAAGDLLHSYDWQGSYRLHNKNLRIANRFLKKLDVKNLKYSLRPEEEPICSKEVFYALFELIKPATGKKLKYSCSRGSPFINEYKTNPQFKYWINIGYVSIIFY
ncbi:MAG: AmmeMemoRadiSam system protein B [Candidatus Omnitrophota bacterium]